MEQIISETLSKQSAIHLLQEEKFKTNLIKIYFQRPLKAPEATYNALISMVLPRGTKKFQTAREISMELERLYGAYFDTRVVKKGERQVLEFTLGVGDLRYIEDQSLLDKAYQLIEGILYDPLMDGGQFREGILQQEIQNLRQRIESRINDKNQYALERCIEAMCEEEAFALYEWGRIEDLENLPTQELTKQYQRLVNESPVDIVAVGNLNMETLRDLGHRLRLNQSKQLVYINREKILFPPAKDRPRYVKEKLEVSQGKLTIGYRTNIPYESELYPALMLYSHLLGGGAHSKLFLKVREEKSLCYYIYCKLEKFKSILLVSCGIEAEKYEEVLTVINQQLELTKAGEITDEEMENTRKAMINTVLGMKDNQNALADYYHSQILSGEMVSPGEMIEKIKKVTKEQVMEVAAHVAMDTVYFLSNSEA